MDVKGELKAEADKERHYREFIAKHGIPIREWQLAEEMEADFLKQLLSDFWKAWEEGSGKDLRSIRM